MEEKLYEQLKLAKELTDEQAIEVLKSRKADNLYFIDLWSRNPKIQGYRSPYELENMAINKACAALACTFERR